MFDLIFSFIILMVSFGLIFVYYINVNDNNDIYDLNKRILDGFTNTKINTLNNIDVREMFVNNKIRNLQNTVAQQVGEFHYYGDDELAKNLTEIFVENFLDRQMNFNLTLENETGGVFVLYSKLYRPEISPENSSITAISRRTIFGFNQSDYYGPYKLKIKIWK